MFRKVIASILIMTMVMAMNLPVYGAEDTDYKGEVLRELNLMSGYEDGSLGLDDPLTREQNIVLVLRLMGYTYDDLDAGNKSFDDVPVNHWAAPWIAKAKDLGITSGISPTEFGLGDPVSIHEITTFMLNVLEYNNTWHNAHQLGFSLGLIDENDLVNFEKKNATRGDFVDIAYEALSCYTDGGDDDVTLIEGLVAQRIVKESKAIKYGFIKPKEFGVEEIEALNLIQFVVRFNEDVDEDTALDEDNYDSEDIDLRDAHIELLDDDTVLFTLEEAVDQQTEAIIEVQDVEDLDEKEIKKFEEEIEFVDKEFPEILDVNVVGEDTIEVIFSEPMDIDDLSSSGLKDPFTMRDEDDSKVSVDDVEFEDNNTVAYVSFYNEFEDDEVYDLHISPKYDDYAGYTYQSEDYEIDIREDDDGPKIVDVKDVSPHKLTIILNEPIKELPEEEDIYHTNSNNHAENLSFGKDKDEIIVSFGHSKLMPDGYCYINIKAETIEDLWGNENENRLRIEIEVDGDNERPELESIELGSTEKELVLTFNEDIDGESANDKDNYTLLDEDEDEIESFIRRISTSQDEVTLELRDSMDSGDYTLIVEDIEDMYGNEMHKTVFDFNADDVTRPDFDDFEASVHEIDDEYVLVIDFKEKMDTGDGPYSVTNPDNYLIDMERYNSSKDRWEDVTVDLEDLDDYDIDTADKSTKVEIIVDERDGYRFRDSGWVYIAKVSDWAGNETKDLSSKIPYGKLTSGDTIGMDDEDGFRVISATEAKLTLESMIDDFYDEDFIIEAIDESGHTIDITDDLDVDYTNISGKTVIIIEVEDDDEGRFTHDAKWQELDNHGDDTLDDDYSIYIHTIEQKYVDTENKYGQKVELDEDDHIKADDEYAPEVVQDDDEYVMLYDELTHSIMIPFTEKLEVNLQYVVNDFEIEMWYADKREIIPGVDFKANAVNQEFDGYKYCLQLELMDTNYDGDIEVYMDHEPQYVKDVAGNNALGDAYADIDDCIYHLNVNTLDLTEVTRFIENELYALKFNKKLHEDSIDDVEEWITTYLTTDLKLLNLKETEERLIRAEDIVFVVEGEDETIIKFMVDEVYRPDGNATSVIEFKILHDESKNMWVEEDEIKDTNGYYNDQDLLFIKVKSED